MRNARAPQRWADMESEDEDETGLYKALETAYAHIGAARAQSKNGHEYTIDYFAMADAERNSLCRSRTDADYECVYDEAGVQPREELEIADFVRVQDMPGIEPGCSVLGCASQFSRRLSRPANRGVDLPQRDCASSRNSCRSASVGPHAKRCTVVGMCLHTDKGGAPGFSTLLRTNRTCKRTPMREHAHAHCHAPACACMHGLWWSYVARAQAHLCKRHISTRVRVHSHFSQPPLPL